MRSLNSNNSYGKRFSCFSVDPNETVTTTVTTRDNEAVIGRALVSNAGVYRLEQEYAGETYTSATETITGSGANANLLPTLLMVQLNILIQQLMVQVTSLQLVLLKVVQLQLSD